MSVIYHSISVDVYGGQVINGLLAHIYLMVGTMGH